MSQVIYMDKIIVKGARENNLKNIDIELPKNKLIVMTGLSGSGKSSLAFDTIYAEGQRRYVESLSAYARQFLGNSEKPDVDSIEGLSPAISIDQKTTSNNPRSTVGTVTEIYDYLRLLYARVGVPYCPTHNIPITSQSIEEMTNKVLEYKEDTRIIIMAPVVHGEKGTHQDLFDDLRKKGFTRVRVNDKMYDLSDDIKCEKNKSKKLSKWLINSFSSVVIDHIKRNHPIIFHETFYVTYCKSIHDDLCGRYYVITDDDTPIDVSLCTFNNPHTIIDINDMQLVEINKLSNPTINELSESNYSNLVSGVTDIVSKRFTPIIRYSDKTRKISVD